MIALAHRLARPLCMLVLSAVFAACGASAPKSIRLSDQEITSRLSAFFGESPRLPGAVLVARGDKVLLSNGYGMADRQKNVPNTAGTKFRIASITKQFTAMAILILQSRGQLHVQDRVCAYLTDCPPAWKTITLHQLLTHTSGLPDYYSAGDWPAYQATPMAPSEIIAHFIDKPLNFQPGEEWGYSNSGYTLLGAVIEQVSGLSYEDFIQANILDPLKMVNTGYLGNPSDLALGYADASSNTPVGFEHPSSLYASGGMYSTVEDLYLWDRSLYTHPLIPADLRDVMLTPQVPMADTEGTTFAGFGYGYGWIIGEIAGRRMIGHTGRVEGFVSCNTYYPDQQVVVIALSNQHDAPAPNVGIQIAKYIVFSPQ